MRMVLTFAAAAKFGQRTRTTKMTVGYDTGKYAERHSFHNA